ncbi:MAG TPA: DUF4249 family protein [Candidatus Latescibacteria bacterium]|nr:DUF4249 family protein [Candidatus Latescibacterota bacterium]
MTKTALHRLSIASVVALTVAGCGLDPVSPAPREQLIIQAFLSPGAPVDNIRLTRTMDPATYYEGIAQTPVSGAVVVLRHGVSVDTLSELAAGIYGNPSLIVQAGQTYSIAVTHGVHSLAAETTVPTPVTVSAQTNGAPSRYVPSADTLVFPREYAYPDSFPDRATISPKPFKIFWTPSVGIEGYQIAITARDTSGTGLLRLGDYNDWKAGDYRNARKRQREVTLTYPAFPDSLSSDLFWVGFKYQGRYDIIVFAMDRNFYNYFMSSGGGNSGADYDTGVTNYVRGGLGVFGSYAADTVRTFIKPEWLPSAERP